jgi:hypothetical protein
MQAGLRYCSHICSAKQLLAGSAVVAGISMLLCCPQVLAACTKFKPAPYKDEALLQSIAKAAMRRWGCPLPELSAMTSKSTVILYLHMPAGCTGILNKYRQ